ncbi:MAG: DUF3995 domain-containing protein [Actinomycetota bacterium]|nr:DUF3995 domain-containing protein [Actinomycetota bacterium]
MTTGTTTTPRGARAGSPSRWTAYAACVLALLYALVSFYWAAGGTAGLSTIGGELEEMARDRDPGLVAIVLVTAFLKVAYGLLALALVRPSWGRALPRWALLWAAWAGAGLLSAYGGLLVAAQALVVAGFVGVAEPADRRALLWHLFVWDPWFLVMGLLLGVAVWHYQRGTRRRR